MCLSVSAGASRINQPSTMQRAQPQATSNRHRPLGFRSISARPKPLDPSRAAKIDIDARFVNIPETHRHRNAQTQDERQRSDANIEPQALSRRYTLPPTLGRSRAAGLEIDARFRQGRRDLGALLTPKQLPSQNQAPPGPDAPVISPSNPLKLPQPSGKALGLVEIVNCLAAFK